MNTDQSYEQLLESKIKVAERHGIEVDPDTLNPYLRPDQRDIAAWCLAGGARLVAPDAGYGKTGIGIE
ncbi:MAG: hypothetical protein EOP50_11900, partial [Sphingobacteriales bacterium]